MDGLKDKIEKIGINEKVLDIIMYNPRNVKGTKYFIIIIKNVTDPF